MRLENMTRGTTLASAIELARSPRARMKGLLGRDGLEEGGGLVLEPCTSIHMFFMRFPIDVLFVDARGEVLRAIEHLAPWRLTRVYPRARFAAELPAGTIARTGTREGDKVQLTFAPGG
jgi:uncharacterized membrane protein (UPF0127 family)